MSIFDIATQVENQAIQLDYARAVLQAVTEEIEEYNDTGNLRQEHVICLLHTTDLLLYDMCPVMRKTVNDLMEKHKEQK